MKKIIKVRQIQKNQIKRLYKKKEEQAINPKVKLTSKAVVTKNTSLADKVDYNELTKKRILLSETYIRNFNTIKIINNIRKKVEICIDNGLPLPLHNDLYSLIEKEDILYHAYEKLQGNFGKLTKGSKNESIDEFSNDKIKALSKEIKNNTFKFSAIRRVYVPKPGKTEKRPLGIPNFSEKLVQEAVRLILEAIYEPVFEKNDTNFGFRAEKSCHDAINSISIKAKAPSFAIEGDIKGAFDNVNHDKLMDILFKRIKDLRFLNLIYQGLKSGLINEGVFEHTIIGTPQGGIASPILFNIYLNELDEFVLTEITKFIEKKNLKEKRIAKPYNPKYSRIAYEKKLLKNQTSELFTKKRQDYLPEEKILMKTTKKKLRLLTKKQFTFPSTDRKRLLIRIYYCRYADDWVLFTNSNHKICKQILSRIRKFLSEQLYLTLSPTKTLLTPIRKKPVNFLGFSLLYQKNIKKGTVASEKLVRRFTRRTTTSNISVGISASRLLQRFYINGYCDKNFYPIEKSPWSNLADMEIIKKYNQVILGTCNYFVPVIDQKRVLSRYLYILQYSCLKTLAQKFKTTIAKIIKKYGGKMPITATRLNTRKTYNTKGELLNSKQSIQKQTLLHYYSVMRIFERKKAKPKQIDDVLNPRVNWRSAYKLNRECCICGSTEKVESHHVKHIRKGKVEGFLQVLNQLNRRQIVCCFNCHRRIHKGEYDGISLQAFHDVESIII